VEQPLMRAVLRKAIESPVFSKDILPKVPLTVFESEEIYKDICSAIKLYYQTNTKLLGEATLLTLMQDKLDRMKKPAEVQQDYYSIIHEIYDIRDSSDDTIIDEKIEEYIKRHIMIDLFKKGSMSLSNIEQLEKIVDDMKKALIMDVNTRGERNVSIFKDREYVLQKLQTLHQVTISTGFVDIDALCGGGLAKGELGLVVALSGTGKTTVLINLALNYIKRKYNVLFVALEETEERMFDKFYKAMLDFDRSFLYSGMSVNMENWEKVDKALGNVEDSLGHLIQRNYPPRTTTPAKIEQILSDCILRDGINIDVVIVDYPELLRNPNASGNEAEDGGRLFEEMRRIGREFNVIMWTAAQMNRTAMGAVTRTSEHMEGSVRKKNAAELVLTVNQTPEEREAGFMRLYADKVRNPPKGTFDRMIGLKYISGSNVIRSLTEEQAREHKMVLIEADNNAEQGFKKRGKEKSNERTPDYANEINNSIQRMRG
jgi:replicative DNA helicase